MPFTLDGEWIPSELAKNKKPITLRVVKRGNKEITIISHLDNLGVNLEELLSSIKKKLGCGGSCKEDQLEIQGNKISEAKKILESLGLDSK